MDRGMDEEDLCVGTELRTLSGPRGVMVPLWAYDQATRATEGLAILDLHSRVAEAIARARIRGRAEITDGYVFDANAKDARGA